MQINKASKGKARGALRRKLKKQVPTFKRESLNKWPNNALGRTRKAGTKKTLQINRIKTIIKIRAKINGKGSFWGRE